MCRSIAHVRVSMADKARCCKPALPSLNCVQIVLNVFLFILCVFQKNEFWLYRRHLRLLMMLVNENMLQGEYGKAAQGLSVLVRKMDDQNLDKKGRVPEMVWKVRCLCVCVGVGLVFGAGACGDRLECESLRCVRVRVGGMLVFRREWALVGVSQLVDGNEQSEHEQEREGPGDGLEGVRFVRVWAAAECVGWWWSSRCGAPNTASWVLYIECIRGEEMVWKVRVVLCK